MKGVVLYYLSLRERRSIKHERCCIVLSVTEGEEINKT